eukprot:1441513-Rhodomonas_salina.1
MEPQVEAGNFIATHSQYAARRFPCGGGETGQSHETGPTRGNYCWWVTTAATATRRVTTPYLRRRDTPARTAASSVSAR